jgi:Multicopper oxidase
MPVLDYVSTQSQISNLKSQISNLKSHIESKSLGQINWIRFVALHFVVVNMRVPYVRVVLLLLIQCVLYVHAVVNTPLQIQSVSGSGSEAALSSLPSSSSSSSSSYTSVRSRSTSIEEAIPTHIELSTSGTIRTVVFDLRLHHMTSSPDGISIQHIGINGHMPGPTLRVRVGDEVVVRVVNELAQDTTLHFHGLKQKSSNLYDGVPGVTQCPIAPGTTFNYTFMAAEEPGQFYS